MFVYTANHTEESHLNEVMAEMKKLGSPAIRVVDCADYYIAIEGCHRIEAARLLGIKVELVVLEQNEEIEADSLDLDGLQEGETYTAGEIAGECYHPGSGCYDIDDDGNVELVHSASQPF